MIGIFIFIALLYIMPFLLIRDDVKAARQTHSVRDVICVVLEIATIVFYAWWIFYGSRHM